MTPGDDSNLLLRLSFQSALSSAPVESGHSLTSSSVYEDTVLACMLSAGVLCGDGLHEDTAESACSLDAGVLCGDGLHEDTDAGVLCGDGLHEDTLMPLSLAERRSKAVILAVHCLSSAVDRRAVNDDAAADDDDDDSQPQTLPPPAAARLLFVGTAI